MLLFLTSNTAPEEPSREVANKIQSNQSESRRAESELAPAKSISDVGTDTESADRLPSREERRATSRTGLEKPTRGVETGIDLRVPPDSSPQVRRRAAAAGILEILNLNREHSDLGLSIATMTDEARREAIEESRVMRELIILYGDLLDVDDANSLYPDLGTKIEGQLVKSYRMMNAALEEGKPEKLRDVYEVQTDLASWLTPRGDEIVPILLEAAAQQ